MRANLPVIKVASDTPGPTTFRVWDLLSGTSKAQLVKLMRKRGNSEWNPGEVIEIEPSEEIKRIMESNSDYKKAQIKGTLRRTLRRTLRLSKNYRQQLL